MKTENKTAPEFAIVLGGGITQDGTPSPETRVRALAGIAFAKSHPSCKVILSGYAPEGAPITEAEAMARLFDEQGIPRERLLLEDQSRCTMGNAILVRSRFMRTLTSRKLYIVTSPFHSERAALYFRGVFGPQCEIEVVQAEKLQNDEVRQANEAGGIEWGKQFFAGTNSGDLEALIERLRQLRPAYNSVQFAAQFESEAHNMCMCENDNASIAVRDGIRLPDTVSPEHYAITLRPDIGTSRFTGEVSIDLKVKAPSDRIVLNAVGLEVSDAYVTDTTGSRLNGAVTVDKDREQVIVTFGGSVGKGKWKLHLAFAGELSKKLNGFYRSTYKGADGKEHVIASTQFEPNDARRAFPCFDEPMFKATYQLTLVVDEHLTAISNDPVVKETIVEEKANSEVVYGTGLKHLPQAAARKRVVEFDTTMKMSTYIVAFVIGEFEATEPIMVNGTAVRVYCVPGKKHLGTFALKAAQFSLTWFEKYFDIPYPGKKLDLIGIPDFAFGAMENLGCVTFRETALLVNEETATIAEMSRVAEVVAHEIAHMWFGDLVTMKWWNGLWLNEAFATFMATKVEDAFRPQWQRWVSFGIERAAAMRTDALASTRSIEAPVEHPAQALGMIDVITYRKGCSVLRQLEQFIGEQTFRDGIRVYLKKHAYSNAETTDLWDAIDSVSEFDVRAIMNSWVFQPGYPVISVSRPANNDGAVTLAQSPFKYLADAVDPAQQWLVPVNLRYKTADGVETRWVLLDSAETTVYLGENLEWVVVNAGGHGFYRTRYSPDLAAKLTANINDNLSSIERFNLVNDSWACVLAGLQTAEEYLNIVELFADETDPNVWSILRGSLSRIYEVLPERNRSLFAKLVRRVAVKQYMRLGWDEKPEDTPQDRQVRGIVIAMYGTIGNDGNIADKAKGLFARYKTDRNAVASDIVPAMIELVASSGGQSEYDELTQLFQSTQVPQEQVRFLQALALFHEPALLEKTLRATVTPAVRTQDAPALLVRLLGNFRIASRAWDFIKENWAYMVANYPETGMISLATGVTALDRPELEQDVREFFAANPVKGGEKAVAQALELLRVAVRFKEREAGPLAVKFSLPVVTGPAIIGTVIADLETPGPELKRQ